MHAPACAFAHDAWADGSPVPAWVKAACCGESDAHRLTPDMVHQHDGYLTVDGFEQHIPDKEVLPSQDGHYWLFTRCNTANCSVFCFFSPMDL